MSRTSRLVILFVGMDAALLGESSFLQRNDVRVVPAKHGKEALDVAKREAPCLVVVDVEPGGRSGFTTCALLKNDPTIRKVPVVLVLHREDAGSWRETGATTLVFKPVAQEDLLDTIRRFVAVPERRAARCHANLRFTYSTGGETGQAFSRVLSSSGVYLKSDRAPRCGAELTLRFHLPGEKNEIACSGVVRTTTSEEATSSAGPGFGVEFETIDGPDRGRLARFVESHGERSFLPR
jgi:CheY-like chemotaxis protein